MLDYFLTISDKSALLGRDWLKHIRLDCHIRLDHHGKYAAPIVVVLKSDQTLRISGDYNGTENSAVEEEPYTLRTAEDVFDTLAGGNYFTKLDLSHTYQQLELEDGSKQYLVVNTHKVLNAYNHLAYGVSSAPALLQSVMDQILPGLENVVCFLPAILFTAETK